MKNSESLLIESHYLPNVQYFSKLARYSTVFLEKQENYQKGSYRNRCHIAGANGLIRLSIPLRKGKNEQQPIYLTQIAYDEPWRSEHWNSIRSAYSNAPYFPHYSTVLQDCFQRSEEYLFDWNLRLIRCLIEMLQLEVTIKETGQYHKKPEPHLVNLRNSIHPKPHRRKTDDQFIALPYPQVFMERHGFLPNLSILDLLFCTGPQALLYLEQSFQSH